MCGAVPHLLDQGHLPLELLLGPLAVVQQLQDARHVALGVVQQALGGGAVAAWGAGQAGGGPPSSPAINSQAGSRVLMGRRMQGAPRGRAGAA